MGLPIIGDIFSAVSGVFSGVAGWAIDSVIAAITSWVLVGRAGADRGDLVGDRHVDQPDAGAGWFSGPGSSPFEMALGIGGVMLLLTSMAAVIRAVLAGSPGGIVKAVGRDLPAAIFTMVATIAFTSVALELTDADLGLGVGRHPRRRQASLGSVGAAAAHRAARPALRGRRPGRAGAGGDGVLVGRAVRPRGVALPGDRLRRGVRLADDGVPAAARHRQEGRSSCCWR